MLLDAGAHLMLHPTLQTEHHKSNSPSKTVSTIYNVRGIARNRISFLSVCVEHGIWLANGGEPM
jgi:hypothetical protein